jgi:hypothetical protein
MALVERMPERDKRSRTLFLQGLFRSEGRSGVVEVGAAQGLYFATGHIRAEAFDASKGDKD